MKPDGPVFDKKLRQLCEVVRVGRSDVDCLIKAHYLKKWPAVCTLILGLRKIDLLGYQGVIVYSMPPRETIKRYGGLTWELARLFIKDSMPRNTETFFISRSVEYIKRNRPEVKGLVSYADPSAGHAGIIYKAANWSSDGKTDQGRKTPRFDYVDDTGKKYGRCCHIPIGREVIKTPRVSKYRFYLRLAND